MLHKQILSQKITLKGVFSGICGYKSVKIKPVEKWKSPAQKAAGLFHFSTGCAELSL